METLSNKLFSDSKELIPGGVNSPVRAFTGVHGDPIFINNGNGPYIYDVDGKEYIDFIGSWGPMILGHNHPVVVEQLKNAIDKGLSFGAPTSIELEMADFLTSNVPNLEMVRMVSSGTEATMSAIRLARGYTNKNKILKFIGCYHGHSDSLLVKAGSGLSTFGVPSSAGVPEEISANTLLAHYNDIESVYRIFEEHGNDIACVIVEPVAGNMNCIIPVEGFLEGLRECCDNHGSLLIFDEVMTGFRVDFPGAQTLFDVNADLITLGKIIGGGLPVGAFGGKKEIMSILSPLGPVYQAGTLSGNPVAMAAGLSQLRYLEENAEEVYTTLDKLTSKLLSYLRSAASMYNIPFQTVQVGSMFGVYFTTNDVLNYDDVSNSNIEMFKDFHKLMLERGIYFAPSAYEAGFVSLAHTDEVLANVYVSAIEVFEILSLKYQTSEE